MTSFCDRKASIFAPELLLGRCELLLLLVELLDLPVEILELLLRERLPLERGAREILPTGRDRVAGLRVQLDQALLQLVGLELKPLLGGRDVRDPPLDVLEQLTLLLVGVVQRLGRVLRPVEELVQLRLDHQGHALDQTGHRILLLV